MLSVSRVLVITIGRYCEILGKFWPLRGEMDSFETMMTPLELAKQCLQLGNELGPEVESFVYRFGSFSFEVRLRPPSEGTRKDSRQLNPNAKAFNQMSAECSKKQGAKDPKDGIGKSQSKI